jgi:hypothetical protein
VVVKKKKGEDEKEVVEEKPRAWLPEEVQATAEVILGGVKELIETVVGGAKEKWQYAKDLRMLESKHSRNVIRNLLWFLVFVVSVMAGLTYLDKVGGESLLFLTGTIVGFVISIIHRHLFPPVLVVDE